MAFSLDAAAEAAILAAARGRAAGRDQAFGELYRALREPVLALCVHVTGRRDDAEDALQETFLSVHRALPAFRREARLSTWVYRIALRAAIRVRAQRPQHDPSGSEGPGDTAGLAEQAGGGGEGPMLARLEARRVEAALGRLPAEHRAVLSLFAVRGLTHRQIAEILRVPEGTVWSRLHAARARLTAELRSTRRRAET